MENLIVKILIFMSLWGSSCAMLDTDTEAGSYIPHCMSKLCDKYFQPEKEGVTSLVIVSVLDTPQSGQAIILQQLFDNVAYYMSLMTKSTLIPHRDAKIFRGKAQSYLIFLNSAKDLSKNLQLLTRLPSWNPNGRIVVVFLKHHQVQEELDRECQQVFNETFALNVWDVFIIFQHHTDGNLVQSLTWFPYDPPHCAERVNRPLIVDECRIKTEDDFTDFDFTSYHQKLFPKIPETFHLCPLKVTAVINEPFVFDFGITGKRGAEYILVENLAGILKMRPEIKVLSHTFALRMITDDPKNGFYSDILSGKSQIMIGGLYESSVSQRILSTTIPYYQDDFTWCVQRSQLEPKWKNVFIIFDLALWAITLSIIFCTALFLNILLKFVGDVKENYLWSFLITISLTTSNYGHYWPSQTSMRIFVTVLCLYGIVLHSAYRSSLIKVIKKPRYEPQISSVQEAVKFDFTFTGGENTLEFLNNDVTSRFISSVFKPTNNLDESIMELVNNSRLAVAIPRARKTDTPLPITDYEMYCFDTNENIRTYPISMMTRAKYLLIPRLNTMIGQMSAAGLVNKFEKESRSLNRNNNNLEEQDQGQSKLTLEHVQGAFYLWSIGVGVAAIGFVLEWITFFIGALWKNKFFKKFENYLCFSH